MSAFAARACKFVAPDPCKHVKYTLGMVLGVDDFEQEFVYHAGHRQWALRDVVGYGTVNGLQVLVDKEDPKGPRIRVTSGVAVSPGGHLICVPADQCAFLNDWLAVPENKKQVEGHKVLTGSPPGEGVSLYVVLCYRTTPTDSVPIPGEPCRSEDLSMAPSRWADDFTLELRFHPPDQPEEDALREFVRWLKEIQVTDAGPSMPLKEFLEEIRDAVVVNSPLQSPPSAPQFLTGSPPVSMQINSQEVCEYLRAAFRLWVTELRPWWHAPGFGQGSCCEGQKLEEKNHSGEDCVLLAALKVPLTADGQVADVTQVKKDEAQRPILIHLRVLQEWLLCGRFPWQTIPSLESPPGGVASQPRVVAAGQFQTDGTPAFSWNGDLTATPLDASSMYLLQFSSFDPTGHYVVKGTALTTMVSGTAHVVEVIPADEVATLSPPGPNNGIVIRVRQGMRRDRSNALQGFMIEITQY